MFYRRNNRLSISLKNVELRGELIIPLRASSIVIFAHGSGSNFMSPRNQAIARRLHQKNMGTLLIDLLTEEEDALYRNRFDIALLSERLKEVTKWIEDKEKNMTIGYFGGSTGAAAALKAASGLPEIAAVVSRGGRPDLVLNDLPLVQCPTLLIVGSLDHDVMALNKIAFQHLQCEKKFEIIEGATHLFEENGMTDKVSEVTISFFEQYLHPVIA